jgi:hypothetical protein
MSSQYSIEHTVNLGGREVRNTLPVSGGLEVALSEVIQAQATDVELLCPIDVSQVAYLFLLSDVDLTLETNSGSAADETIELKANVPYEWHTDSYDTLKFETDITSLFATNEDQTTDANLTVLCLLDATL